MMVYMVVSRRRAAADDKRRALQQQQQQLIASQYAAGKIDNASAAYMSVKSDTRSYAGQYAGHRPTKNVDRMSAVICKT